VDDTILVRSVGEVASRLFLGELLDFCHSLLSLPLNQLGDALVDLVAAILFEIALNVAQQRDVEYCRNDQQYQRAEEHSDGENDGHQEAVGYHVVFAEVFGQIPPLS